MASGSRWDRDPSEEAAAGPHRGHRRLSLCPGWPETLRALSSGRLSAPDLGLSTQNKNGKTTLRMFIRNLIFFPITTLFEVSNSFLPFPP